MGILAIIVMDLQPIDDEWHLPLKTWFILSATFFQEGNSNFMQDAV
jgi:hypothetical protein